VFGVWWLVAGAWWLVAGGWWLQPPQGTGAQIRAAPPGEEPGTGSPATGAQIRVALVGAVVLGGSVVVLVVVGGDGVVDAVDVDFDVDAVVIIVIVVSFGGTVFLSHDHGFRCMLTMVCDNV
jgi:hypothetical protein